MMKRVNDNGRVRGRDINYYNQLFYSMKILPSWLERADAAYIKLFINFKSYNAVEKLTTVDWKVVAIIHELESSSNFSCQLLNGQRWDRKTTIVPKNLGPWKSWEESCIYAFRHLKNREWTIEEMLKTLEEWNGLGYYYKGVHSPYLWSGSNHGVGVGKYVADGKYSKTAVSKQIGGAVLLRKLLGVS